MKISKILAGMSAMALAASMMTIGASAAITGADKDGNMIYDVKTLTEANNIKISDVYGVRAYFSDSAAGVVEVADLFSALRATTGIRSSGAMVAVKVRHTTFSMMQIQSLSQDLRRLLSGQTLTFQIQRVSTLRSLSASGGAETSTSLRSFFSTRTARRSRALT